jgi:alpha-amylase
LFYPQYYGVTQVDNDNNALSVTAPVSLQSDINKMISLRSKYLGGSLIVLTEQGNPVSEPNPNNTTTFAGDAWNVYVARRQGNGTKSGAILVMNNNDNLTRGIWVDNDGSPNGTSTSGYADWKNQVLVNVLNPSQTVTVAADGRVHLYAPPRGYSVWVLQSEYVALRQIQTVNTDPIAATKIYPNPSARQTTIEFSVPEKTNVQLEVYDMHGRRVSVLSNTVLSKGRYKKVFTSNTSGAFTYQLTVGHTTESGRLLIGK